MTYNDSQRTGSQACNFFDDHGCRAHFRPWGVDGQFDAETAATLFALLEKYYPDKLAQLTQE